MGKPSEDAMIFIKILDRTCKFFLALLNKWSKGEEI